MSDNQKLPPPNTAVASATISIGGVQISPGNDSKNMSDSGVAPQQAIKKLEEAIKKGTFEGIESNDK